MGPGIHTPRPWVSSTWSGLESTLSTWFGLESTLCGLGWNPHSLRGLGWNPHSLRGLGWNPHSLRGLGWNPHSLRGLGWNPHSLRGLGWNPHSLRGLGWNPHSLRGLGWNRHSLRGWGWNPTWWFGLTPHSLRGGLGWTPHFICQCEWLKSAFVFRGFCQLVWLETQTSSVRSLTSSGLKIALLFLVWTQSLELGRNSCVGVAVSSVHAVTLAGLGFRRRLNDFSLLSLGVKVTLSSFGGISTI